jgi:hypothetical protein
VVIWCCIQFELNAQIKIGDNPNVIDSNSVLEIESTNKGLLLPRLLLSSTTTAAPLSAFVQGMFVYNTATSNDVIPGIYYCDGSKWVHIVSDATSWNLNGNSGTLSANHFLGTTDQAPLVFKTNNAEHVRITENGRVGIGTANPAAALQVHGEVIIDSLSAGDGATDGILVANPATGKVRVLAAQEFVMTAEKSLEIVQSTGQSIFNTPDTITDSNKILLYRNGILISFTVNNATSIISEMPCSEGDEIKIIQLK